MTKKFEDLLTAYMVARDRVETENRKYRLFEEKPTFDVAIQERREARRKLLAYVAELESERRWIPVSERMPEDGQEALICYDGNIYLTTYEAQTAYLDDHNNSVICRGFRVEANDFLCAEGRDFPSHWMPLPEPPVSEAQE